MSESPFDDLAPATFESYPKMPRMKGALMTITEKIDGTNAQILIADGEVQLVGSRKREIFPDVARVVNVDGVTVTSKQTLDNYGFARWVLDNEAGLVEFLGDGRHYGEWAGLGIQKNPLGLPEKMFFLFNTHRNPPEKFEAIGHHVPQLRAVPVLLAGTFSMGEINLTLSGLLQFGSQVDDATTPQNPEGVVISAFGQKFKRTADDRPKGER